MPIVGMRDEGRLDVARGLSAALRAAGWPVGGFLQVPHTEDGVLVGYDAVRLDGAAQIPVARESEAPIICRWGFSEVGFRAAREWTLGEAHEVSFVDAGPLEAAERGHWPTLLGALATAHLTVVSVRRSVLARIALCLPDPVDGIELPADPSEIDRFYDRIARGREDLR